MIKKIICVIISIIIICSLVVIPVSATELGETGSDVNLWTYDMFGKYWDKDDMDIMPDIDFINQNQDNNYVFMFNNSGTTTNPVLDYSVTYADGLSYDYVDKTGGCVVTNSATYSFASKNSSGKFNSVNATYYSYYNFYYFPLSTGSYAAIYDDLTAYNKFVSLKSSSGYDTSNIYYCPDLAQSYLDFYNSLQYDDMFFDVYPIKDGYQNIIRFYDCWDSYYGKYQYDYYTDNMHNYLNSSFSVNVPIYYQSSPINTSNQLEGAELQHNEFQYIYFPAPDDLTVTYVNDYCESIGYAIHYENGVIDFGTWYDTYIVPWLEKYNFDTSKLYRIITLRDVEPSTSDKPTTNLTNTKKDVKLLRIPFPSAYTFLESTSENGKFIMSGCRTMSTAQKINITDGSIDNTAKDGVGSNIDGGDYLDEKDKDELLNDGWQAGYPNRASYPYKVTINKNGYILYEIYFDKKPSIKSNFFSHSQIAYDIDFNLTRGYIYAKQQNCYLDFNFRNIIENDYSFSDGTITDSVTDEAHKVMAGKFGQIIKCLVYGSASLGADIVTTPEEYTGDFSLRVWTNYTGQLTGAYRGYYTQFNWDLESDDDFIKNNSDDNHNYSDDFLNDGDGFVDNNGNIHGGAVDITSPTDGDFNFNDFSSNFDFSVDELTPMITSFLRLLTNIFSVFPDWVWRVVFLGFSVLVVCKIIGR